MMRALWTAGSGMKAQQFNVDVISNNLANVNTVGYKKERAEFKDLLYETINRASLLEGQGKPVNIQVGHGTSIAATVKNYEIGNLEKTDNPLDFAIDGEGFFMIKGPTGETVYTRDGSFKVSVADGGKRLTTSDGYSVLDSNGNEIIIPDEVNLSRLSVSPEGDLSYIDNSGVVVPLDQKIGLVKFPNRYALEGMGKNFFVPNSATGAPVPDDQTGVKSTLSQGFLESSNVQVVEEMVRLIVAQRAYEINSKAIQSADEMLGMANNLRR
ncbi:MAG: flagellar hook-basal body protein [Clostridia bacterium]|nr:flagellar hook-basal body protein [Clostridia bacterium]